MAASRGALRRLDDVKMHSPSGARLEQQLLGDPHDEVVGRPKRVFTALACTHEAMTVAWS